MKGKGLFISEWKAEISNLVNNKQAKTPVTGQDWKNNRVQESYIFK